MSVKQIEEAISRLPSDEFAQLLAWMQQQQRDAESERETAYLLDTPAMKARLLEARASSESISLEEARARLGMESAGFRGSDVVGEF